jgi:plastocyanin
MAIAAIVVVLAILTAACNSNNSTSSAAAGGTTSTSTSTSTQSGSESSSGEDSVDVSGKSTMDLEADNFYFEPSTVEGAAGQKITIKVEKEGSTDHTFTIDSENIDVTLSPGDEQEVSVTFPKSGSVQFYCKFHKSMGMTGSLEVA